MPITPFLDGERFVLEGERVLRIAFEMVCIGLRTGDCDDGVKQAIATKLIALSGAGTPATNRVAPGGVFPLGLAGPAAWEQGARFRHKVSWAVRREKLQECRNGCCIVKSSSAT